MQKKTLFATPAQAFVSHLTDAPVIGIELGKTGFYPIYTKAAAAGLNPEGATPEIIESAIQASMFGWDAPVAAPARNFLAAV